MSALLRRALIAVLVLALAACAGTKKAPAPEPSPREARARTDELVRDRFIVPGARVGPVLLGMPLHEVIRLVGEPVSSAVSRIPGGRAGLLYRYPDPDASGDGGMLVLVREYDQTVYSIDVDRMESFQTREGVRPGSSEALVRATFGKPQSVLESSAPSTDGPAPGIRRTYCYLAGLAVRMNATGGVESLSVFPGSDLRKICTPH